MLGQDICGVRTSGLPSFVLIILDAVELVTRLMWSCSFSGTRFLLNKRNNLLLCVLHMDPSTLYIDRLSTKTRP